MPVFHHDRSTTFYRLHPDGLVEVVEGGRVSSRVLSMAPAQVGGLSDEAPNIEVWRNWGEKGPEQGLAHRRRMAEGGAAQSRLLTMGRALVVWTLRAPPRKDQQHGATYGQGTIRRR
jgi:hypothetical protein